MLVTHCMLVLPPRLAPAALGGLGLSRLADHVAQEMSATHVHTPLSAALEKSEPKVSIADLIFGPPPPRSGLKLAPTLADDSAP